jgi:hypothetical protein
VSELDQRTVWLVEAGEYEDRMVFHVAASLDAAVEAVKRAYAPPYVVRWESIQRQPEPGRGWRLTGHFEAVAGKSVRHTGHFDIEEWDVEDSV